MSKTKEKDCKNDEKKPPKARFSTKLYFWLFIILMVLAIFLFWSARNGTFTDENSPVGISLNIFAGIIAVCLSIFFALICFIRFIRSRSIAGGLFLTTCMSTGIFLGTSQLLPAVVPSTAAAFSASPEATNNGMELMISLAQIGLFAIWFIFLLFTIYLHISPIKRIDKYLQKLVDGENVKKVRIGKAKQYREIEEKIKLIADHTRHESKDCAQATDGS